MSDLFPFTRRVKMNPHYYIMKSKKILRLEEEDSFEALPTEIKEMALEPDDLVVLDQSQANWRVVIFRDEIMELSEYQEWLVSAPHFEEDEELDLIAN